MKKIPLSKGYEALVDDKDFEEVNEVSWYASIRVNGTTGRKIIYAVRNKSITISTNKVKYKRFYLHRVIMKAPKGTEIDHINGNPLDCRKKNMRITDRYGNMRNRRKRLDSKESKHIGTFNSEIEAAIAYDKAAKKKYGEFARLNFS